ncbi:hypothetical protein WKT22_05213 [Candidatus Lokiarchaeum ossiferum]
MVFFIMTPQEIESEKKRKLLYTYWHKLKYFKTIESSKYSQVQKSEVQSFIIKYIRDGLEDEFGKKFQLSRRHAFTAKELHTAYLKKQNSQQYSLSNFHFHIKSLVEDGYLKEIVKILEGRHYIAYYGRTAIVITEQLDNILTDSIMQDIFNPMKQMAKDLNPEIDSETIDKLVDESVLLLEEYYFKLFSWIKDNYPLLYKSKIDIHEFVIIAGHFAFFCKDFAKNLEKVGTLIGLDKIMEYERYKDEKEI